MILRTKLARASALVAVLILLCGCQPNQDEKSITNNINDINERINHEIARLASLEGIHQNSGCGPALIEWKGGTDNEKLVGITVDPLQNQLWGPNVEVCLSQSDSQIAKLKITNFTATDYDFVLPPNVYPYPGTIPTSDDSRHRFAAALQSDVYHDPFTYLVPNSAVDLAIPISEIDPQWTVTLRVDPAAGQILTMTFVTGQALGLIVPPYGVASAIHDCMIQLINDAGRTTYPGREAERVAAIILDCLPLAPNFARGSKAADYIEWAKGQIPAFVKVFQSLDVFKPHPDVSITLTKSGPLPPVQLNPHDPALGNPAQPLQQKRQQKKKEPPPIEEQKELVDPKTGFDPTSGRPGSTPNLFGGGFYPNKDITITESSPAGSRPVGVITPDASGRFDIMFQIPDSTPAGQITYTFRQEPNLEVADTFLVGGAPIEEQKELVDPKTGFDPTSGRPGSTPNLFGGGFYPNKDITITESSPAGSRPVGVITPDASGSFDIMFQIPVSTPAGQITYTFRQEPDVEVADTFLVGGEPVSTPEPMPSPEEAAPTTEETPTTEPSETPTSAPTETATASTPEPSEAAKATTAPETTPSASVPFYTLAPTP